MHNEPKATATAFPKRTPFRITNANVLAWKGKAGEPSRGIVVDGNGRFYPTGEPVFDPNATFTSERKRIGAQIPRSEMSARRKFQEETKALRRSGVTRKAVAA